MGYKEIFFKAISGRWIKGDMLATDADIDGSQLKDASVTGAKLVPGTVLEAEVGAGVITATEIAANAGILGSQLASNAGITGSQIANTTIATANLVAGAVTEPKLGVGTLHQVKTSIGHANATPTIATLPAGSLLLEAWTVCTETYNATIPTIDIGYAGNATVILPTASIGKTNGNVSGDDPAVRGTDLWVPGVQTKTPSAWAVTGLALNEGTPNTFLSVTQGSTAGDWTVTTYGHKKAKFYAAQTVVIATIAGASGNTTGTMDVYLSYLQTA